MTDDSERVSSVAEDEWVELAAQLRKELAKAALTFGALNAEEQKDFVATCKDALQFDVWAQTFDKDVEINLNRTQFYG